MKSELAQLVSARFGRQIKTRRDCEELSVEIQIATSELLSYNTIRRFFGLDKNQFTTRKQTLNILSRYSGYDDYLDFKKNYVFGKEWSLTNLFHGSLENLEKNDTISLLKQVWVQNKNLFVQQITETNKEYIRNDDIYSFLSIITQLDYQLSNLEYSNRLLIAQGTLIHFRGKSLKPVQVHSLSNNRYFQEHFICNFVDIPYLKEGYYAQIITNAFQFENTSIHNFITCAITLHKILNEQIHEIDILPILSENQHPILKGRIISILYWASENNLLKGSEIDLDQLIQKNYDDSLFLELATFGILFRDYNLISRLIKYDITIFTEEYKLMHNEIHNLAKSLYFMHLSDKKRTKKFYNHINVRNVNLSHKCLFDESLPLIKEYINV